MRKMPVWRVRGAKAPPRAGRDDVEGCGVVCQRPPVISTDQSGQGEALPQSDDGVIPSSAPVPWGIGGKKQTRTPGNV